MLFQFVEQLVNVDLLSFGNERAETLTLGPNVFHALVEFLLSLVGITRTEVSRN